MSAWGNAFGSAWGDAWGAITQAVQSVAFGGHYAPKKRDDTADDIRAALAQLNRVTSAAETIARTDAVQMPRFEPAYDRLIEAMNIARVLVDEAETRIERTRLQVSIANAEDARKKLLAREQAAKTIAKARARRAAAFLAVILGDE
jgi:hypothetical protein